MKQIVVSMLALAMGLIVNSQLQAQQGTFTQLTHASPSATNYISILLSDGTVMVAGTSALGAKATWNKLTPDSNGNYVNGTWSPIASMSIPRLYFGSNVLPSGKVFVMGGEYSGVNTTQNFINTGEIYDPVANSWSPVGTFPMPSFGDDPTILLKTGKILCGYIGDASAANNGKTFLYDPATNTFSPTGTKLLGDVSDEETWTLLPDGSVLSYNIFASPATGAGSAQRYIPSTGQWVATGPVPVPLTNGVNDGDNDGLGFELGPQLLLPDGRVFLVGANNNTVLYNPSSNTWTQGPSLPANFGCDDAPGVMLPNGHVLFVADQDVPIDFNPPSKLFDFNPVANTITDVTPTGTLGSIFAQNIAQEFCFLVLPNGHVLMTTTGGTGLPTVWDYTPAGSPSAAWAPVIKTVTRVTGNTYTMTGTQLNGISEGSSFGDDLENSTNYPIVRLKNLTSGVVTYARTTNWAPGLVASGSLVTSVQFTLPNTQPNGAYQLSVIANGIPSTSQNFLLGGVPSNVIATYSAGTLTLTGDANPNSLTVSLQAGLLTVQGANGTTINSTTSFSHTHSGALVINASLNDGDDAISVIGVTSSTTNIQMGAGNDQAAFTLSTISNLTIDGGAGTDTLLTTSSKITALHETNVP